MTIQDLIAELEELKNAGDPEVDHIKADRALLQYIDDEKVTEAFFAINKWYA